MGGNEGREAGSKLTDLLVLDISPNELQTGFTHLEIVGAAFM